MRKDKKFLTIITIVIFVFSMFLPFGVSALDPDEKKLINQNILYYSPVPACEESGNCVCNTADTAGGDGSLILNGRSNPEKAFNFFVNEQKFSPELAAAFIGNFQQESGAAMSPTVVNSIGATGIAQWLGGRKNNLFEFGKTQANSLTLSTQLLFVMEELNGSESAAYTRIKAVTGTGEDYIATATHIIRKYYERPGEAEANDARRIKYALDMYRAMKGTIATGTPIDASGTTGNQCADGSTGAAGSGTVNTQGYSWPVEPQRKSFVNNFPGALTHMPCSGAGSCHGGRGVGTAYDLGSVSPTYTGNKFNISVGKKVYAIHNGQIENMHIYQGVAGCYSLQLKADDGYFYWYGHIRKPVISNGDRVNAGQPIAEIGEPKCASNTTAHLHIDRGPKGSYGGSPSSRDGEGMVKLMNSLFEGLPE